MRALVVYESMFGNTRSIALAVAEGIARDMPVQTLEVSMAPKTLPADVALLVVGGPTHAHGMSTSKTRADAADRAGKDLVSRGIGVAEWLATLHPTSAQFAAAFDTRIKGPGLLWGSAAKQIATALEKAGFALVAPAQDFLVGGPLGPMFDRVVGGELEHAREWGTGLAQSVVGRGQPVLAGG